jgi:hypothetical protein
MGMRYSLINYYNQNGNKVDGYWMQDCYGTLDGAKQRASELEAVNSNNISVAVVAAVNTPVPMLEVFKGLDRLD